MLDTKFVTVTLPDGNACIEIAEGPFAGLRFNFGAVRFPSPEELQEGVFSISYDYTMIESPRDISEDEQVILERVLDGILHKILLRMSEEDETLDNVG